jgi:hypothetical protein
MNNNPSGNSQNCGSCSQPQTLVNQNPVYDRKLKIHRPRKKKGRGSQPKFV